MKSQKVLTASVWLAANLLASGAMAQNDPSCDLHQKSTKAFEQLSDTLAAHNVCDREAIRAQEAKENYEESFPIKDKKGKDTKVNDEVFGFSLQGHPDELVAAKAILEGVLPDKWAASARNCPTVLCAFTALLGSEEAAHRVLSFHKDTGYAISTDQSANSSRRGVNQLWNLYEIRMIDQSVRQLPSNFHKMKKFKRFIRAANGITCQDLFRPNCAAFASWSGVVTILEDATKYPSAFSAAVVHEVAHEYDFENKVSHDDKFSVRRSGFPGLSGWERTHTEIDPNTNRSKDVLAYSPTAEFVSPYAKTDAYEDLADSIQYYVHSPKNLKDTAPKKYQFIKENFFANREYEYPKAVPETVFESIGGPAFVQKSCSLDSVEYMVGTYGSLTLKAPDGSTFDKYKGSGHPFLDYLKKEKKCLEPIIDEIAKKFPKAKQSCPEALKKEIQKWILEDYALQLEMGVQEMIRKVVPRAIKSCKAEKNLSKACLKKNMGIEVNNSDVNDPTEVFFASKLDVSEMIDVSEDLDLRHFVVQQFASSSPFVFKERLSGSEFTRNFAPIAAKLSDQLNKQFSATPKDQLEKIHLRVRQQIVSENSSFREGVIEPYLKSSQACSNQKEDCLLGKMKDLVNEYFARNKIPGSLSDGEVRSLVRKVGR